MIWTGLRRRSFLGSLMTAPLLRAVPAAPVQRPPVEKVAAGAGHGREVITLPGGDPVYVKVSTQETGGALFVTEQPAGPRGSGPPKHYHEDADEWFYCLEGVYVVEIGDERFRLGPGDSVLGPRRVPHAFAFDADGRGKLLVGFSPAGNMERFFRDLEKRGIYFGSGTAADKETARRLYGIVNVGPPLNL
jgi:quercetin dioxygenase-like cupin family protein